MKIYLATALTDRNQSPISHFELLQRQDRFRVHELSTDAASAHVILFVDPHLHAHRGDWNISAVRHHPLARAFPDKTLVFDERDDPWPDLPGIYLSLPAPLFDPARHRAYAYPVLMNELVNDELFSTENFTPELLFSFVGTLTHPVRRAILALAHERGHVEENRVNMFTTTNEAIGERKQRFAQILRNSKFVLCPRGMGTASIRLFETLRAGRVPVIISDDWVAPVGPDWDSCSLRVRENQVASLPALLEDCEARWPAMSQAARATYEEWFGPQVMFHRIGDQCAQLLASLPTARRRPTLSVPFLKYATRHLSIRARVRLGAARKNLFRKPR